MVWKKPFLSMSVAILTANSRSLANDHDSSQSITSLPVCVCVVCCVLTLCVTESHIESV